MNRPSPIRPRGTESPEYAAIKPWFFEACRKYVDEHDLFDEDFFIALVTGDVKSMVTTADDDSQRNLWLMLKYLYNHVPFQCWGSVEAVSKWVSPEPKR